eukprot:Pgem_evm1s14326
MEDFANRKHLDNFERTKKQHHNYHNCLSDYDSEYDDFDNSSYFYHNSRSERKYLDNEQHDVDYNDCNYYNDCKEYHNASQNPDYHSYVDNYSNNIGHSVDSNSGYNHSNYEKYSLINNNPIVGANGDDEETDKDDGGSSDNNNNNNNIGDTNIIDEDKKSKVRKDTNKNKTGRKKREDGAGKANVKTPSKHSQILENWFDEHKTNPYPQRQEKLALSEQTGLTLTQVNWWFINRRRSKDDSSQTLSNKNRTSIAILKKWLEDNKHHPYPERQEKRDLVIRTGLTLHQINWWFINRRRRNSHHSFSSRGSLVSPSMSPNSPSSSSFLTPSISTISTSLESSSQTCSGPGIATSTTATYNSTSNSKPANSEIELLAESKPSATEPIFPEEEHLKNIHTSDFSVGY